MIKKLLNKFKKKPVVSLNDFIQQIKEFAESKNQTYYLANIKYISNPHSTIDLYGHYTFEGYVNGFGYQRGATPNDVLKKFKEYGSKMNEPKEKISDVEVNIEI